MTQQQMGQLTKSAKIITVYNQKGGCGKSMLTMQLAGSLGLKGYTVLVIDLDPQHTACSWSSFASEDAPFPATVTSMSMMGASMTNEVRKCVDKFDFIFLDCPPQIESTVPWAALNISDVGLIPFMPAMDNVWAHNKAVDLGRKAQQENPHLTLYFVGMAVERSTIGRNLLDQLYEQANPIGLKSVLSRRNAFRESQLLGGTVYSLGRTSPAAQELDALTEEFLTLV